MTSKYDHIASTKYLSNLCKDGTPLRGRIALLSFRNEISARAIDTAIMIIEYGQLVSTFLRGTFKFYTVQTKHSIEFYNFVSVITNVMSPGTFLPYNKEGLEIVKRVFECCIAFYLFRILLFLYIIWLAWNRKSDSNFLVKTWQWIFHLQTKVFCSAFASIYSNTYDAASKGLLGASSGDKHTFMVGGMIMIGFEFALSILLTTQFTNILPFKRFSASKDNYLELNVLLQKFVNYILRRVFKISINASKWVLSLINIAFGIIRMFHAFHRLPMYNYKSLRFQMHLIISTFALSVACFSNLLINWKIVNMNFVLITWVILHIFCAKLSFGFLERKLWKLTFEKRINTKKSPEYLVHKIIFMKHILTQNKPPGNTTSKSDINHLLASTLNQLKLSNLDLNCFNLEYKATRNKVFMLYLDELMAQFPKNNFLKLYSAYRYVRKNKLYGLSIKTLAEIDSNYPTVVTSKSILKHFIQTKTQLDYQYGVYVLNLYDYCKGVADVAKMKLKMAEQAKLQWNLCNEITSTGPDLASILHLGSRAQNLKQKIHKNFKKIYEQTPDHYVRFPLLYAYYNLFLGYSSEEYSKYKEISSKRSQKYHKQFENDQLVQENLFQRDTFFIVVSGEKETAGIINYISPELVEILGRNLTGTQASVTTPPFIRASTASIIKSLMGQNALSFQNTERFQFFYHLKGYMVPFNYYLNINPSTYGGLSFIFICRRANQGKEYILLNDEGEIESFTKGVGELLGLFSKEGLYLVETKALISQVCPELARVNKAFNIVTSFSSSSSAAENVKIPNRQVSSVEKPSENSQSIGLEEAKEIYSMYTSEEGKNITLTPIHQANTGLTYRCTVKTLQVGTRIGKVLTLEKVHQEAIITENNNPLTPEEEQDGEIDEEDLKEDVNLKWINFERLKSEQQMTLTTRNDNLSSARQLISPRLPPLMTQRGTTEANERLLLLKEDSQQTSPNDISPKVHATAKEQKKKWTWTEKYKPHWLLNPQATKINKLYQQALDKRSAPFFYNIFIATLHALFLAVFTMNLYMSINMHDGISELQVSKQILRMAEARNNYLGTLDGSTRFLWTYATQPSSITDVFEGTFVSLPVVELVNQITVGSLDKISNSLFALTSSLNQEQRDILFQTDIRMFDVNSSAYINMTSFQASDRIVEESLKSNSLVQTSLESAVPYLQYVLRNILNDMLIKNTEISESFKNSLQDKKTKFENWITASFATSLSLLVLIVIGFLYVLYLQAKNESNNLFALTRLKPESLYNLKQSFLIFHDLALTDDHSTSDPLPLDGARKYSSKKVKQQQQQSRQFPIEKGLYPAYYLYLLRVGLLLLIPFALFLVNFVLFKRFLDHLSTKTTQIYFIEQMSSRLGVVSGSFLEVTSQNDTTVIENIQASKSLLNQISTISEMIQSVSDTLGVGTSENNDLIQDVLYGDACSYLKYEFYYYGLCKALANYQEKPGLTNLLSNLEASMKSVYTSFINSDREEQTLLDLQVEAYNEISAYAFLVIIPANNLIAEVLNKDFEEIVSNSQALNIALNAVLLAVILAESLIIHVVIVNKLKQKETQFKRILGLFPANVVLPNFILKSYIMKTSNQTFSLLHENA